MRKTRQLAESRAMHVTAVAADLANYDLGVERWDLVVSVFAHMPPAIRGDLHRRVVTSLKPGGVFLLEAYTPEQVGRGTGGPPSAELTMTLGALRNELAPLEFMHAAELSAPCWRGLGTRAQGQLCRSLRAGSDARPLGRRQGSADRSRVRDRCQVASSASRTSSSSRVRSGVGIGELLPATRKAASTPAAAWSEAGQLGQLSR